MKALSVRQPWAHGIAFLGKSPENRTWHYDKYGCAAPFTLAIHASKTFGPDEQSDCEDLDVSPIEMTLGAFICIVTITGCIRAPRTPVEREWFTGPYGFTIADVRILGTPVPWRGQLGIFDVPDEIFAADYVAPPIEHARPALRSDAQLPLF